MVIDHERHYELTPSSSHPNPEEIYSRKTPLEHILLRPSMYVGPAERMSIYPSWLLRREVVVDVAAASSMTTNDDDSESSGDDDESS